MLEIDEATEVLCALAKERELIIFVGSGISIDSNLPTWDGFLEAFIEFCKEVKSTYGKYPEVQEIFSGDLLHDADQQRSLQPTHVATVLKEKMSRLPKRVGTNVVKGSDPF